MINSYTILELFIVKVYDRISKSHVEISGDNYQSIFRISILFIRRPDVMMITDYRFL